jgi:hypothetical protein
VHHKISFGMNSCSQKTQEFSNCDGISQKVLVRRTTNWQSKSVLWNSLRTNPCQWFEKLKNQHGRNVLFSWNPIHVLMPSFSRSRANQATATK